MFGLVIISAATSSRRGFEGANQRFRLDHALAARRKPTLSNPFSVELAGFVPCALSGMKTFFGERPWAR